MQTSSTFGAALELKDLYKFYGDSAAVNGVSLTAARGEFLTFLGPSGSGKTTTLNMVAGLITPSAGRLILDDRDIAHLPPRKRNIGMVFQHYALFPHMSAAENVAFPLKQRKVASAEVKAKVAASLEMVGLGGRAHAYPRELSGGQQQRVALARAMVFEPTLLLMDEPLGALDRQLREQMQLEIKRIHLELGITFVYVTHDQEEALVMSDRIAIFNEGIIEQVGTASEVYDRPTSLFAAQFLGESNCFAVNVERSDGYAVVEDLGTPIKLDCGPNKDRAVLGRGSTVMIRPERLKVVNENDPGCEGLNRLPGRVQQIVYLGSARRLEVEVGAGHSMSIKEQTGAWSPVDVGDQVQVGWQPSDAVLIAPRNSDLQEVVSS